jgi:hypothetical protein
VAGGGHVEQVGPGILSGGAQLDEEVRPSGVQDPAMKAPVPQPCPVRLALPRHLAGLLAPLVENVHHLVHRVRLAFESIGRLAESARLTDRKTR